MRKTIFIILLILALASFLVLFSKRNISERKNKFNVILIVVDALRADHLGCYGYYRDTSPAIDKFAQEGTLFVRAFSQGPQTLIAVPSIFTSLYPGVLKVLEEGASVSDPFTTLPEIMEKDSYSAAAFLGPQLKAISNLDQGFGAFRVISEESQDKIMREITGEAVKWLQENHSRPFFVYVHYLSVHSPYKPNPPYDRIFSSEEIDQNLKDITINSINAKTTGNFLSSYAPLEVKRACNYAVSQYDGAIRQIDEQIKVMLEVLEKTGLSRNTLVILTSDHGEEFLEHGQFFHGRNLYDESIRVPLIMRLPGVIPEGEIIRNLVRHIDIMPTVLKLLGIRSNNHMQGTNLLPLIRGKKNIRILDSFSESYRGQKKCVRTESWKLIENIDGSAVSHELYNLNDDPEELDNLFEKKPEEREALKAKLGDYDRACDKIRSGILGKDFVSERINLDEESKKQLKGLGYMQ